MRLYNTWASW